MLQKLQQAGPLLSQEEMLPSLGVTAREDNAGALGSGQVADRLNSTAFTEHPPTSEVWSLSKCYQLWGVTMLAEPFGRLPGSPLVPLSYPAPHSPSRSDSESTPCITSP